MNKKNICYFFLHKPYGRGSGRYLRYLMDYFKAKNTISLVEGMNVKSGLLQGINIYNPKIPFQIPVYQGRTDVKKNIKISKINNAKFNYLINVFRKECLKIHKKKNLDMIHVNHCSILPYVAYLVKEITGVPYIVMAHGTGIVSSMESKRNFDIAKTGLENAECIMANSKFVANQVIKKFRISSSKVKVVYLGVNTNEFYPTSKKLKEKIKAKYNCKDKKIIYSTGYLTKEKGFQDLIKAASIYEKKDENIITLISGKGPYQKELERLSKKLRLKRTKILGWIPKEDLLSLYAAADIVVMPSRWGEPFGMVTIEAMSSGTPVIGTRTGATPEIISKKTGILVKPKNPKEMAEAVKQRIFDDNWLNKAGKEARALVKKKFSIELMCRNTEKIYENVIG